MKMTFDDYCESLGPDGIEELAAEADTSPAYIYQLRSGFRRPGADVSDRLMEADPNITYAMLKALRSA